MLHKVLRIFRNILVAFMLGFNNAMNGDKKSDNKNAPDQELPE